jgi:hypothetical protein
MLNICAILDVVWKLEGELNDVASCTISQQDTMEVVCHSAHTMRKNRRRVKPEALLAVRLPNSNIHLTQQKSQTEASAPVPHSTYSVCGSVSHGGQSQGGDASGQLHSGGPRERRVAEEKDRLDIARTQSSAEPLNGNPRFRLPLL